RRHTIFSRDWSSDVCSSDLWGTGIEQLMIGFVQWTIGPWVKCWEEELNRKLLTEEERDNGFFIKFNLNAILRGDMAARASFYEKDRKSDVEGKTGDLGGHQN